jgi:hypothetical protein
MSAAELGSYSEGSHGFHASVEIRRSDGTPKTVTAHRIWDKEVERYGVEQSSQDRAEFARKWLQECQHAPAKTESKAVLRAIRAALQIPHTFSREEAARPFVVVGYSFTPNYDDPEMKRLLIEKGYATTESVYGAAPEIFTESAADGETGTASPPPTPAEASPGETPPPTAAPTEEEPAADGHASAGSAPFEGDEPPAPEPESRSPDPGLYELPAAFSRFAGRTLASIEDEKYLLWLASDAVKGNTHAAAVAFLEARDG